MITLLSSVKITFKPILTLSIILIFTFPTYSQQNSKILSGLKIELKDKNLYLKPIDSILKKFNDKTLIQEKKVLFADFRKITEAQKPQTAFDESIKVDLSGIKIFDSYTVSGISFYFNKSKLIRCWIQFELPIQSAKVRNSIDSIYNRLNQDFNLGYNGVETNLADCSGYRWTDKYAEVDFLTSISETYLQNGITSKTKPNTVYLSIEMFNPTGGNPLLEEQTIKIKNDRFGKGNGSFVPSLNKLESIIKSHTPLNLLERQFSQWSSYGAGNNLGYEYNDATNSMSIPLFQLHYESTIRNKSYIFKVEVSRSLKNPISYLEFITTLNGYELAMFKKSLIAKGYFLNENLTQIFHKTTFQNKLKKLMVTIKENSNGDYTIGIR